MSIKKWGLTLGFCFVVVAILATIKFIQVRKAIEFAASFPEPMETVELTSAHTDSWTNEVSVIAETVAIQSVELKNELAGVIEAVHFESGEQLEEGQLLVSLETDQEKAQLAAIRADAKLAQSEYERAVSVVARGAASKSTEDQRKAERDSLLAREKELLATISKKNIRAPFDARAGLHDLNEGQYLTPGTLLTNLIGVQKNIWVDFNLPQQKARLSVGDSIELSAEDFFPGRKTAQVIARSTAADTSSRNVRYRAVLENTDDLLFPGIALTAHVATSEPVTGIVLPTTAIRYDVNGPYAFLLDKLENPERGTHRAVKRPLQLHAEKSEQALITSGLGEGDEIAAAGSFKLREGILVNAVESKATAHVQDSLAAQTTEAE